MTRLKAIIAPAFLLICILLGGSSVAKLQNGALQLLGILVIGIIVALPRAGSTLRDAKPLIGFAIAAIAIVVLQLHPASAEHLAKLAWPRAACAWLRDARLSYSVYAFVLGTVPHSGEQLRFAATVGSSARHPGTP